MRFDQDGRRSNLTVTTPPAGANVAAVAIGATLPIFGRGMAQVPSAIIAHGELVSTAAKLLARKQQLLERLQADPGPHEREQLERLLEEVETALELLDETGPGQGEDKED